MAESGAPERKKRLLLGGYFASLQDTDGKVRYLEKLSILGGFDPYESEKSQWLDDIDLWPSITHIHLVLYTPSRYTGEDLLKYKSLDCYINFVSGWVREVMVKVFDQRRVVLGKVRQIHSIISIQVIQAGQPFPENEGEALDSMVIAEEGGTGHCDCMAGLGETCCCSLLRVESVFGTL